MQTFYLTLKMPSESYYYFCFFLRGWMNRGNRNCSKLLLTLFTFNFFRFRLLQRIVFFAFPAFRKCVFRWHIWKIAKAVVVSACPFTEVKQFIEEGMKGLVKTMRPLVMNSFIFVRALYHCRSTLFCLKFGDFLEARQTY